MADVLTPAQRIGRQVRVALLEQGRSQNDVAALLGLTYQAVSRRTLGQVSFRGDELVEIAQFLGVDPGRFLQPIPEPRARDEPVPLAAAGRGAA